MDKFETFTEVFKRNSNAVVYRCKEGYLKVATLGEHIYIDESNPLTPIVKKRDWLPGDPVEPSTKELLKRIERIEQRLNDWNRL